ncbi:hypothetical protein [Kribbella sp. CA-294648]|uniref:hypothetical protein n=1 Tax=Kribbella sp. CA-294648 TaxID=3239948 RepID=UPI003D8E5E61
MADITACDGSAVTEREQTAMKRFGHTAPRSLTPTAGERNLAAGPRALTNQLLSQLNRSAEYASADRSTLLLTASEISRPPYPGD